MDQVGKRTRIACCCFHFMYSNERDSGEQHRIKERALEVTSGFNRLTRVRVGCDMHFMVRRMDE